MIRRISRNEARVLARRCREDRCCGREACRRRDEADKAEDAIDVLEVKDLVDLAVKALADYGVNEIDYEKAGFDEDEMPEENEAICADEEGNEVGVKVDVDNKTLTIDLDEEDDIIVDLAQPEEDVTEEIKNDLEVKLGEQEEAEKKAKKKADKEAEECNRRFEAWKRERRLRKEGKRIPLRNR